jgi:hypothetical protein
VKYLKRFDEADGPGTTVQPGVAGPNPSIGLEKEIEQY